MNTNLVATKHTFAQTRDSDLFMCWLLRYLKAWKRCSRPTVGQALTDSGCNNPTLQLAEVSMGYLMI